MFLYRHSLSLLTIIRCYENWFTVDILISNKEDLIFLLGEAGLQNVVHYEGCYSELVVSKLFPAKLNFSSQTGRINFESNNEYLNLF